MVVPKVQKLILVGMVILAVVILSALLLIGPNRVTAQAQSELSHLTALQKVGTGLAYQEVYTNSNSPNFPTGTQPQSGQLRIVTDPPGVTSGSGVAPQSINSGFEYIPSSAFRSDGFTPASEYRFVPTRGFIRNNSTSPICLAAPVYVPNGATLTRFSMFFVDDNAANDLTFVKLWRKNLTAAGAGTTAQVVASMAFPSVDEATVFEGFTETITAGTQTVSNDFGYYIGFCFNGNTGSEQLVYGFKVAYNP